MRPLRAWAAALALSWGCVGQCMPAETPARSLASADQIEADAAAKASAAKHATAAQRKAARALVAEGDAAYRQGRYDDAHRFFDNASPNAPSAYAYLMTADSHWRASVAFGRKPSSTASAACRLQRRYFVDDLRLDLNQGYLLGLRLAQIEPGHPLVDSPFLARARNSATCLARLADELAPEPPETCVDEARIAACLGAPLLK
jgi:hypothetical protein